MTPSDPTHDPTERQDPSPITIVDDSNKKNTIVNASKLKKSETQDQDKQQEKDKKDRFAYVLFKEKGAARWCPLI